MLNKLFCCCLIVGCDKKKPHIKFKYPEDFHLPERIADLCFPEVDSGPLDLSRNAQSYTLLITNDKGERIFGYCLRVVPEGFNRCIPLAYCILSRQRAPRFYNKVLRELESLHGVPDELRNQLLGAFYHSAFPVPGKSVKINLTDIFQEINQVKKRTRPKDDGIIEQSDSPEMREKIASFNFENVYTDDGDIILNNKPELTLNLHHDIRYEEADLKPLHELSSDILLKVFASLLAERKVIFVSCILSKLSCCVDALQSILYPFSWPHTFIPILPQCLWDVVESPTPVICGIVSVAAINRHKIEDGIVVDLDEGNILLEEGDEKAILPKSMRRVWKRGITLVNSVASHEGYIRSVYLRDAYIKVFIVSMQHYKNHIIDGSFDVEGFIRCGTSRDIRKFLKWFSRTQLFCCFIESVLDDPDSSFYFDNKITYSINDKCNYYMTKLLGWSNSI